VQAVLREQIDAAVVDAEKRLVEVSRVLSCVT
jgi:hypothetical protein